MRVGILGGTFNPIHSGHLILAEQAREALDLDRVLFIPNASPPHKPSRSILSGKDRLLLVRAAIKGNPAFAASDIELKRGGISYTLETVQALHKRFPQWRLFLIIGQDMLGVRWRGWDEILKICRLGVAVRPDAAVKIKPPAKPIPMPPVAISSSDIRGRVAAGQSIRYLVPKAVEDLIRRRGWYKTRI